MHECVLSAIGGESVTCIAVHPVCACWKVHRTLPSCLRGKRSFRCHAPRCSSPWPCPACHGVRPWLSYATFFAMTPLYSVVGNAVATVTATLRTSRRRTLAGHVLTTLLAIPLYWAAVFILYAVISGRLGAGKALPLEIAMLLWRQKQMKCRHLIHICTSRWMRDV